MPKVLVSANRNCTPIATWAHPGFCPPTGKMPVPRGMGRLFAAASGEGRVPAPMNKN